MVEGYVVQGQRVVALVVEMAAKTAASAGLTAWARRVRVEAEKALAVVAEDLLVGGAVEAGEMPAVEAREEHWEAHYICKTPRERRVQIVRQG